MEANRMSFLWPTMLLLLALMPVLIVLYLRVQRRRRARVAAFSSLGLPGPQDRNGQSVSPARNRASSHLAPLLLLAGLAVLLVGLARPQAAVELPSIEGTLILAFDVSGSMAATDLQPTRMEAAKAVARDFVLKQPAGIQVGVVAFSSSGFMLQAPTNDQDAILAAINRLAPQQGTSLGQGILAALNTLDPRDDLSPQVDAEGLLMPTPTLTPVPAGTYTNAAMILLSDGENLERPDPLEAAAAAALRGVRIYTVGIGSPAGVNLEVNGFSVHTRLDEPTLQQIALATDGEYFNAQDEQQLQAIYDNIKLQLVVKPEQMEITALFAGASLLILLVGGILLYGGSR
jgi:Ca-activated chloride channel homolog